MCFFIHEKYRTIETAKKDIVCYKRFEKGRKYFRSPYKGYKYEPGECYYEYSFVDITKNEISEGYRCLGIGLHSYSTFDQCKEEMWDDEIIVECIIPEGARYMYNPDTQEYISDYLIIGKEPLKL